MTVDDGSGEAGASMFGDGEVWSVLATGPVRGEHIGAQLLVNVHRRPQCAPHPCGLHAPSTHHMRGWPVIFRSDRYKVERTCPHGVGHPDPDDYAFQVRHGRGHVHAHGCDGCCARPPDA